MNRPLTLDEAIELIEQKNFTQEELLEIEYRLNNWGWDERIAPTPDEWEWMEMYAYKFKHKVTCIETRRDYIDPVLAAINTKVNDYEQIKYAWKQREGTEDGFEQWWSENGEWAMRMSDTAQSYRLSRLKTSAPTVAIAVRHAKNSIRKLCQKFRL